MENKRNYKILIIDDGILNQRILVDALKDIYTIYTSSSGIDALKSARKFRPHLILLDIILPDINGFDVLKQLKESKDTENIPIIIITGLDNDKDEEKGLCMGAVDYIRKPFNTFLVKARVNTHIQIIEQLNSIERLSFFDSLTDLANRRKFDYHMEYEWHRAIRKGTSIGLIMMDLDYFKAYNDTYGHTQGDEMLKSVALLLKKTMGRLTDIPCRWGGEEFAVLIPETTRESLLLIAEKIRVGVEMLVVPNLRTNEDTRITVSIGAYCKIPSRDDLLDDFIGETDDLLYLAKRSGRNKVQSD